MITRLKEAGGMQEIMAEIAKKESEKKKKGKVFKVVLPLLLVLIVMGTLVVMVIFNLFALQDKLFDFVYSLDPDYQSVEALNAELAKKDAGLKERELKVTQTEERLQKLKKELDERKKELDEQEIANRPIYLRPLTEEELKNMKSISKVYSEMNPADAAEILASLYSIDDMAAILYYMAEDSSAAILAVMDRAIAVEITDALLHY